MGQLNSRILERRGVKVKNQQARVLKFCEEDGLLLKF